MDVVKNIWTSIKSGWNGLTRAKRIGLISVSTLTLIIGIAIYFSTQRIEYALLFSGMEEADSGNIVNDLDAQNISYRLEDNGTSIYIDEKYVDKYRIELAVNDMLPSNSVGFEIFDASSMMDTDKDREIKKQRAIQGELERAISALDGIESAKVILSFPENSVFTRPEELEESTASIMLVKSGSNSLPTSSIQGIASLVSGAVDNLPTKNVSIIDENGTLLSMFLQENDGLLYASDEASRNREIEKNYAKELEQKLLSTLAPIYGLENLSVSVNVKMDFNVSEEETILYGPEAVDGDEEVGSKVRSEIVNAAGGEITTEALNENDLTVSSVMEGESGNAASYNATKNYELDQKTTRTVFETGRVENISASVILNSGVPDSGNINLEATVRSILGAVEGDTVQVSQANFNRPDGTTETDEPITSGPIEGIWKDYKFYIIGVGALVVTILIISTIIGGNRRKRAEEEFDQIVAEEIEENAVDIELEARKKLKKQIQDEKLEKESVAYKQAKDSPEAVADLIKMWMKDE